MRILAVFLLLAALFSWPVSSVAALPFYNADLGYTIWLPGGWDVGKNPAPAGLVGDQDMVPGISGEPDVCYTHASNGTACLIVSELQGRVVRKTAINNFNGYVVREVRQRAQREGMHLREARFDSERNTLRLELASSEPESGVGTCVVYIVYTADGMLKFEGWTAPGERDAVKALDTALATLYLDNSLR